MPRRPSPRVRVAAISLCLASLIAFALCFIPAFARPVAAQSTPPCRPGEGWRETFAGNRPDIAGDIAAALERQGLPADVSARDYGETDSCGSFHRSGAQLLIRLREVSSAASAASSAIDTVAAVARQHPFAGNAGIHVTYADGATVTVGELPAPVAVATEAPPAYSKKVYVVVYDPKLANGSLLSDYLGWANYPDMNTATINLFKNASGGRMQYTIAQTTVRTDGWPVLTDGHRYTEQEYLAMYNHQADPYPAMVDYTAILNDPQLDICGKANRGEIDEVWIYNGPYFGFYESTLAGPGAYYMNSGPVPEPHACNRLIPIMGPSPERPDTIGHGEGHRMESTMVRVYGGWDMNRGEPARTNWDQWALVDYQSATYNYSGCGSIHYPPNGSSDYDYVNTRIVQSNCDDFANYPAFAEPPALKSVSCSAWNCDHYGYMTYWFGHLPPNAGCAGDRNASDWWRYFANPADALDPTAGCPYPSDVSLAGRVTWADGAPAEGAQVTLSGAATGSATTGVDGRYTFTNLAAGQYEVTASHVRSADHPSSGVTLPPASTTADFSLSVPQINVVSAAFSPTMLAHGDLLKVEVVVENTGSAPAETMGPAPAAIYEENETYATKGFPEQTGKWRVAVNGGAPGSYAWRWGFGQTLAPGQRATVTGYMRLQVVRSFDYHVGIIQENMAWYDEGKGRTTINVVPAVTPTPTPTATRTPAVTQPPATGTPAPRAGVWRRQDSGVTRWIWPIQFVDQNFARFAGELGTVRGTSNAGLTWGRVSPNDYTGANIQDMQFVDRYVGWMAGWNYLAKTTDGGATWAPQSYGGSHNIIGLYFRSRSRGWLVGTSWIRRTTDGGATWQGVQMPAPQSYLQDVFFIDQNVGWVVGWEGNILKSTDGGATWTRQPSGVGVILEGVHFFDANNGVVVGHGGTILTTSNGGASWVKRNSGVSVALYGIEFTDATYGWASGEGGVILMTSDGGKTWKREDSGVTTTLQKISALDANHILVAGQNGVVLRRTLDLTVRARQSTHPPLLDGNLDEWAAVGGNFLNMTLAETIERDIPNSADAQMNLKTSWAPGFLYLAGPVNDDVLIGNDGDPLKPWQSDSFEIGIDAGKGAHQFTFALDGRQADQGALISGLSFYTRTVSGGWNFELAIPASALGLTEFKSGQTFSFTFGLWDDDERGGTVGQSHLIRRGTSTFSGSQSATGWGALQLLADGEPFPQWTETPTPTPTATATATPTSTPTGAIGAIRGRVWNDLNGNGLPESGEPGIFGSQVRVYRGATLIGAVESGREGEYAIASLTEGAYRLVQVNLAGLLSSTPDEVTVNVDAGGETVVNFGDWSGARTWLPLLMR